MSNTAHKSVHEPVHGQESLIKDYIAQVCVQAAAARAEIAAASTETKNQALKFIADEILSSSASLKKQNQLDLQAGEKRGLVEIHVLDAGSRTVVFGVYDDRKDLGPAAAAASFVPVSSAAVTDSECIECGEVLLCGVSPRCGRK